MGNARGKEVMRDVRAEAIARAARRKVGGKSYWHDSIRKAQKKSVEFAKRRVKERGGVYMQAFSVKDDIVREFRKLSLMERRHAMSEAIRHIVGQ